MVPPKKTVKTTKAPAKKKVAKAAPKEKTALQAGSELLQKAFKSIKLPDPFVSINEDSFKKSIPHLPTGSIMVDYLIGGKLNRFGVPPCPGLPRGKVVNLYGRESAGKTTLALTISAQTIANGGSVVYIDWENAIINDYAKALGVPIEDEAHFKLSQPGTLEEGLMVIWALAKAGVELIVIDSVGAGVPKAVMEQSLDEKGKAGRVGAIAAMWSGFLPQLRNITARTGTCVLGISQLRSTISTMPSFGGDSQTTQGGQAWKFYSDVRLGMIRIASEKTEGYDAMKHKKEKLSSGAKVRVRADKCKVSAAQGRDVEIYIKYGDGIDDLRSIIEYGAAHALIRKDGSWYNWERGNGEVLRDQGRDKFRELVLNTPGARDELYDLVVAKIYSSEDALVDMDAETDEDMAMFEINNILEGKNADGTEMGDPDDAVAKAALKDLTDEEGVESEEEGE